MSVLEWDNLQTFVHDWMKGLQEMVDAIAPDTDADNSMLPLASLPYKFDSTGYFSFNVRDITSDYSTSQYGYGYQKFVYGARINLTNEHLRLMSMQYIGRNVDTSPGTWDKVESVLPQINTAREALITDGSVYITNPYEDTYETIVSATASKIYFYPFNHSDSDISIIYPNVGGDVAKAGFSLSLQSTPITENAQGLIEPSISRSVAQIDHYAGDKTIAVFDSDQKAQYLVTATSAFSTNNSVINYTKSGSEYKLYYGDNYLVYALNSSNIYNYQDLFTGTKQATDGINAWHPSDTPIKTPTYNEVKHEDDPEPDKDDIDDQVIGAGANLGSIARLWLLTRQQLIDLHNAFSDAPANYDPLTSFIGVMGFGVQPLKVVGDSLPWTLNPINIRMTNGELWHTHVEAHIIESQVSAFSFPDIHIKRRYNNFLDYSPYATHEIFIPMCGWLTLPDIAVDRTISVTYLPDIESMKCRAIVSVVDDDGDKCVIGVKDGIMGAEVPFSNLNHSVWLANLITNAADVTGEMVTGAIGAGFTKTTAKGATYRPYEGFTIGMAGGLPGAVGNALLSGNVNRTHVVGSNGNRTGFSDGECIMIKSTYHKIDKPDNYDHTIGKVCNKTGLLSEFHGFTVCDNPHIHISALDEEKEEIKRLLEEGVILPDGE